MLTRSKIERIKIELSVLIESVLDYCTDREVNSYDVWRLYQAHLIEKNWCKIVDIYYPKAINDPVLREHFLHRLYCVALEDTIRTRGLESYLKETFYGIKKCGEYRFCELFDNVQCERLHPI